MPKLTFFMHISLDGFVAGPNGQLNWIKLDPEIQEFVAGMTAKADTALYGRTTYQLMESYWPNAGKSPNADKFTLEHATWYANVSKVVLSNTLSETGRTDTIVLNENLSERISELRQKEGRNILIFGSPGASRSLLNLGLIDEFYFFMNPVILREGMQFFKDISGRTDLELLDTKTIACGVVILHYKTIRG
jgi:dihydrofolate reductase